MSDFDLVGFDVFRVWHPRRRFRMVRMMGPCFGSVGLMVGVVAAAVPVPCPVPVADPAAVAAGVVALLHP